MSITVTTRVILLLLCGSLPLMVSSSHMVAFAVFLAYNLFVLFLVYLDTFLSPSPDQIEVIRVCPQKLSIGEKNEIFFRLFNRSRRKLNLTIQDEYPIEFEVNRPELSFDLEKRTEARMKYHVIPKKRGLYQFGDIVIQYRGILELVILKKVVPAAFVVKVYPNIKSISRFELTLRRSHLIESGLISVRKRGSGTDFESLKEYTPDDEYRKIDWKATARKNKPITREYQSEKNQSILVAIDCSRSMGVKVPETLPAGPGRGGVPETFAGGSPRVGVGEFSLLDYAVNAALLLGYLVTRREDKIGLLTFSNTVHQFVQPKRGKRQFYFFLEKLFDLESRRVEPNFEDTFRFIISSRVKRSLVIILTDLTAGAVAQKLQESAWLISRKHLVMVVSIADPSLKETAGVIPVKSAELYEKVVATEVLEKVWLARRSLESRGVMTLSLKPSEVCSSLLANYISLKMKGKI